MAFRKYMMTGIAAASLAIALTTAGPALAQGQYGEVQRAPAAQPQQQQQQQTQPASRQPMQPAPQSDPMQQTAQEFSGAAFGYLYSTHLCDGGDEAFQQAQADVQGAMLEIGMAPQAAQQNTQRYASLAEQQSAETQADLDARLEEQGLTQAQYQELCAQHVQSTEESMQNLANRLQAMQANAQQPGTPPTDVQ